MIFKESFSVYMYSPIYRLSDQIPHQHKKTQCRIMTHKSAV